MQTRCTAFKQAFTQSGDHIQAEFTDGCAVITESFQAPADPLRYLRSAHAGEPGKLFVVGDRHDAGGDRDFYAHAAGVIHKVEIAVRIIEVLRDGSVCPRLDLASEMQ